MKLESICAAKRIRMPTLNNSASAFFYLSAPPKQEGIGKNDVT